MWTYLALLCALLTPVVHAYLLQTFRFPSTPYGSGVNYINSPEHFLTTHGMCEPVWTLDSTLPPERKGDYVSIMLGYHTSLERGMKARVFSSSANYSHFLLMDADFTPCVMGHLRVSRIENTGGFVLRCYACRLRTPKSWFEELGHAPPSPEVVQAAITASCTATSEDANLRAYRRMVLGLEKP